MTLNEALGTINASRPAAGRRAVSLVCGFEPLHLATFLQAHATRQFHGERVEVLKGIYGDLAGNLSRAKERKEGAPAVVIEWQDLDPRLGLRAAGRWTSAVLLDIEKTIAGRLLQLAGLIEELAANGPIALAAMSLPLPPLGHTPTFHASRFELRLQQQTAAFLAQMGEIPGVRVVDSMWLQANSPLSQRLDPRMEMLAGFPYSLKHADAVAFALAGLLHPPTAKKGLIVDLDDTLWGGILGEVGPENVSWHQEHGTQVHALLQQMLGQLAENGVLLAIASKNEYGLVRPALKRGDLLLPAESFFPVIANWERKSAAVSEILAVWNVAADSVVFLDDNPMELEEVQSVFPTIGALRFTPKDPAAVWKLLAALRELFGKAEVHAEDGLRSSSIRAAADLRNAARDAGQDTSGAGFLASLGGCVGIDYRIASADKRYLELINKTNQFNLNGVRMTEDEWLTRLRADGTIVIGVVYEDKFGPLGKIAVLLGQRQGDGVWVASWVMSCRAFSRRIEYHLLDSMFRELGVENLVFDFRATGRNQPLQNLFRELGVSLTGDGPLRLFRKDFQGKYELPHEIRRLA